MYDTIRATGYGAVFYFITLIIMGNIILLNLFLAILLRNYDPIEDKEIKRRKEKKLTKLASVLPENENKSTDLSKEQDNVAT